jgi:hypothetical protein
MVACIGGMNMGNLNAPSGSALPSSRTKRPSATAATPAPRAPRARKDRQPN